MDLLKVRSLFAVVGISAVIGVSGCNDRSDHHQVFDDETVEAAGVINPENWPKYDPVFSRSYELEVEINALLEQMTLEEKVGQILQADISSVTPKEVREYNLGSVLNGGNSAPNGDARAPAPAWLALADEYWIASTDRSDGGVGIPTLWGTDAVHGHNNVLGATIFPHNVGLGAAGNPKLVHRIGQVTAKEMLTTGVDWTFAPTIAISRDDRWGRSYESYSENPELVATYAGELVRGIQGDVNSEDFLDRHHMIATAKHFVGDGGTVGGKDQGDNRFTESELRDLQAAGYPEAIQNGVQVVMASFNSFHGRKLHGHKALLTDVLVGRMAFDGFVVGDWNGHGHVEGCTIESCAQSFNAGVDMFMAPDSWKLLYANTLAQVRSGEIGMARLNQAVTRILRVKFRAGLFDAGLPSSRPNAGDWSQLGSEEHRRVARQAVRESLVLLKNNDAVLPIQPGLNVLVAGDGADSIGKQSGGWTLSWQGRGNSNRDFPNGQTVYEGISAAVEANGGSAELSIDGSYAVRPDVAIVVFGEDPYAEFQGDVEHVDYGSEVAGKMLRAFRADGIKTVSVFLSGRPMWVNPEINASNAFVAAWLPGSEGAGIADVLIAQADGTPNFDFQGRLSFSWPRHAEGIAPNLGDAEYDPLFAYGFGLTYADPRELEELTEDTGSSTGGLQSKRSLVKSGSATQGWAMALADASGRRTVSKAITQSLSGSLTAVATDYTAQEDTLVLTWSGSGVFTLDSTSGPKDFATEASADLGLNITYRVLSSSSGKTAIGLSCGEDCVASLDLTDDLKNVTNTGWQTSNIALKCFGSVDFSKLSTALFIESAAGLKLQIQSVELAQDIGSERQCRL